jgi:hypothetical protein
MHSEATDLRSIYSLLYAKSFNERGSGYPKLALSFNVWLYRIFWRSLLQLVKDHGIELRGRRLLEFAPGSGVFTKRFCALGPAALTGVDIAAQSVASLSTRFPAYTFVQADISDPGLDLPGRPFDFASAFNVLYHVLDDAKFARTIQNLGAHLGRGGLVLVNDTLPQRATEARGHVRFRSLAMHEEAFGAAGLSIVEVRPIQYWGTEPVGDSDDPAVRKAVPAWLRLSHQAWKSERRGYLAGALMYLMNSPRKVSDPLALPFNKFILARKEGD